MAQDRFYFWRGYYDALSLLPTDAQRGRFVLAICAYAFDGEEADLSDDPVLPFAWALVRDQVRESVEIGRKQSERGQMGGRPKGGRTKHGGAKTTAESTAKTTALSGAESGAETTAESGAESVRYGSVPSGCAPSLDAQALAATGTHGDGGDGQRGHRLDPHDPWAGVTVPERTDEEIEAHLRELGVTSGPEG